MGPSSGSIRVTDVDADRGVQLRAKVDRVLDVSFDGQRVWSLWSLRDTDEEDARHTYVAGWPSPLRRFLDGRTRVTVTDHVSGRVLHEEELAFGESSERIAVVNAEGAPMGLDKSWRLTTTFEGRDPADVEALMQAIDTVLKAVRSGGVEPFLAYGTLLGAVREQKLLGHDSDADLGYVSRHRRPVDVARESFALQREVAAQGFATYRYSGAAFRVDVPESDGTLRGLDVFGGFLDDVSGAGDRLYLMGEIGTPYREEWVFPLSTASLEGWTFPVPAAPERLLEATYGPHWRTPDPAFKFETAPETVARLNGWFRGIGQGRNAWERAYSTTRHQFPAQRGSRMAIRLHRDLPAGSRVLDVGAGRGGDAFWLAKRGHEVTAYDFVDRAALAVQKRAGQADLALDFRSLNLNEWRSVLGEGAGVSHAGGADAMLANHVLDACSADGRDGLARFASMTLRGGGRLFAQVYTGQGRGRRRRRPLPLADLERLVSRVGGEVEWSREITYRSGNRHSIGRLIARF